MSWYLSFHIHTNSANEFWRFKQNNRHLADIGIIDCFYEGLYLLVFKIYDQKFAATFMIAIESHIII